MAMKTTRAIPYSGFDGYSVTFTRCFRPGGPPLRLYRGDNKSVAHGVYGAALQRFRQQRRRGRLVLSLGMDEVRVMRLGAK